MPRKDATQTLVEKQPKMIKPTAGAVTLCAVRQFLIKASPKKKVASFDLTLGLNVGARGSVAG